MQVLRTIGAMTQPDTPITVFHNPACGTSRKVLDILPERIKTPFTKEDGEVVNP